MGREMGIIEWWGRRRRRIGKRVEEGRNEGESKIGMRRYREGQIGRDRKR